MERKVDIERLRRDLMDYYGTAMTEGAWPAIASLSKVEGAPPERLIRMAEREGMDLRDYLAE